ncbi:response regulator [Tolypothrix sp. PCC 7910]|uniref:response regulator n=1 Tax=Tolypothrix sp. PCC 7910 TaxID=2099387 RepID=UPI0014278C29|nr:response regulator [Tolypothrix sp. PCC 7910]QIR40758.1 response regulator [Tolypothrix sp. PCC 7910]
MNKTKEILICDDSVESALWLKSALLINGFNSKIFNSGLGLLTYLENNHDVPELLIVDLRMPVISGLEIIQQIKQSDRLKSMAIILVTAMDSLDITNFKHLEIQGFMRKPINLDILISQITAILPKD